MDIKEFADKGIINLGNMYRLGKVMKKAKAGEAITVGMIGGSITQGSLSSTPETCYAYLVYKWWVNKFKSSKVTYINGGIGATTSQFAVARADSDLLCHHPDFIITEFSVNDSATDLFKETYEGLIRKILLSEWEPAVVILNNVQYKDGVNAQDIHNEIGFAYELPMVSVKDSLYPLVRDKKIAGADITPDDLHPNDLGHEIVAGIVINFLEKIYDEVLAGNAQASYTIRENTVTANRYMDAMRFNNKNCRPFTDGFAVDTIEQVNIRDIFKNGWQAKKVGDALHFEVKGSMISVQYKKTVKRKAPIAKAVVDGDENNAVILDGNFIETWGDCLYLEDILVAGENKTHTLDIIIIEADEASDLDFYLVSVIVADR